MDNDNLITTPLLRVGLGAFVALLIIRSPARSAEINLEQLRAKNAASQAAILTIQAHVEVTIDFNPSQRPASVRNNPTTDRYVIDYIRSGNKERIKEQGPWGIRDVLRDFESGKGSVFRPKEEMNTVPMGTLDTDRKVFAVEIWQWALFAMPDTRQPLSDLLTQGEIKALKQIIDEGRHSVYLDIRDSKGQRFEIWVDPGTNYLVRKVLFHWSRPRATGRIEREVLTFREMKPGIFFPERVRHVMFTSTDWLERGEATLSNIRVNESLPRGTFQHVFPPGTMVADGVQGTGYIVGRDGQPTNVGALAFQSPQDALRGPIGTATPRDADEDKGWPWQHLLLIGSGVVLVASLTALFWKRRPKAAS
jgi:hypothetical protein